MNIFRKLSRKFSKKYLIVAAVCAVVGIGGSGAVAEFYPDRKPFDYNKPCNPNDNDKYDRCGSLEGPVFNSFINTPSYGDERSFVDARRSDQTAPGSHKDVLPDVTKGSKEIVVRMYVHNNANQNTNESGLGVAKNTKVRVFVPTATAASLRARGYISADNAKPKLVEDTVDFTSGEDFRVEYIPGSAVLFNNDAFKNGTKLSDSIVTTGALIGDDKLDGNVPGCFEFEAVVQVRLKVVPKQVPNVEFNKEVGIAGKDGWSEKVTVKPGEKLKWLIFFMNKGPVDLTNVRVSDKLPPHVTLVPGTVRYIDAAQDVVQDDAPLFGTGGFNLGTWKQNGGFYVRFETVAKGDFEGCEATIRNIAYNYTDQTPKIEDWADAKIVKENCVPKQPVFRCDALSAKLVKDRTYRFTTSVTAQGGATVKQYKYTFGDNTPELLTDKNIVEHEFPEEGTFVTQVVVEFNVNSGVQSHTSAACKVTIDTTKPEVEVPEVLPVTGAGDLIGIFVATTVAGAVAHKIVYNRRYQ